MFKTVIKSFHLIQQFDYSQKVSTLTKLLSKVHLSLVPGIEPQPISYQYPLINKPWLPVHKKEGSAVEVVIILTQTLFYKVFLSFLDLTAHTKKES